MEFPFDVAKLIGAPEGQLEAFVGRVDSALLAGPGGEQLSKLLSALDEQSVAARGQGGCCPEDEHRLCASRAAEDVAYVLAEGHDVLGFARVGTRTLRALPPGSTQDKILKTEGSGEATVATAVKGGYGAYQSSLQEIKPRCLLDVCIVKGFARRGLGRLLLDAVLQAEGRSHVTQLAHFSPSESWLAFLRRHFGLEPADGKMASSFLLFDDYFKDHSEQRAEKQQDAKASQSQGDDGPALEEVPEMAELTANDPLAAYKADEDAIYTQRTKLFCFNNNEWQDAGAGEVNFLRDKVLGRVRLLWQQESSKRIIANHFIVNREPFCKLERHSKGNDKTWMWTAEERVVERRFALKFKSAEDALGFREAFDEARRRSSEKEPVEWVIVRKVGVTAELELKSRHVRLLPVGSAVKVQEVAYLAAEKHVRARIVSPAGWISILSHGADDAGSYAVERADMDRYLLTANKLQAS